MADLRWRRRLASEGCCRWEPPETGLALLEALDQGCNRPTYLVGDEDGIVSSPATAAEDLIAAARRSAAHEVEVETEIGNGRVEQGWLGRTPVEAALQCMDRIPGSKSTPAG
jgi:hypothetical protein